MSKIARENSVSIQTAWDMLFFDEVIYRLSKSRYKSMFIFKGGLYLQSITGIKSRSTMDMDFKLVGSELSIEELIKIFSELCEDESGSNIKFNIKSVSDITAETKYGGKTIKLEASFFNIKKNFGIDVGFGDVVTPYPLNYQYESLINSTTYDILAYPIETIIAEKFETLISKGINNSRSKDLYDIYLLNNMNFNEEILNSAMINTFSLRGTLYDKEFIYNTLNDISIYERTMDLFNNYKKKNKFVDGVTFEMCMEAAYKVFSILVFNTKVSLKDYNVIIHIVRHGKVDDNSIGGWSESHLTEEGIKEIENLKFEIDSEYDMLISSDLNRAKESAIILNDRLNTNIVYNPSFRETNNGSLKNLTKEEFEKDYSRLYYSALNMNEKYPEGESPIEFENRIREAFMKMLINNEGKKFF